VPRGGSPRGTGGEAEEGVRGGKGRDGGEVPRATRPGEGGVRQGAAAIHAGHGRCAPERAG